MKWTQYLLFGLIAIGLLVSIMAFGVDADDPSTYGNADAALYVSYAFVILCVLASVIGSVLLAAKNPAKLKSSGISLIGLLFVLGVSYGLASGEVLESYGAVSSQVSRLSGAGLYAFYILLLGAFGSIVFSGISKLIK